MLFLAALIGNFVPQLIGAVGEEIGWRGYMLTRLIDARVPIPVLASGLIWGVWHLPMLLGGIYQTGPNVLLSALLFMVAVTTLLAWFFAQLRLGTGSIWPVIILHGPGTPLSAMSLMPPPAAAKRACGSVSPAFWSCWRWLPCRCC
ncbi:MAG: CPBP family intramembrane glutamic endopeptidase [Caldilineaceae bacterium]